MEHRKPKAKAQISSPSEKEVDSESRLGIDITGWNVPTSRPKEQGQICSPAFGKTSDNADAKSNMGIADEAPKRKKKS